jgi:hypothetical protein
VSSERRPLCAEVARADAEPLAATASRVERWLLVEYHGVWAHDAVAGSALSVEVKAWLKSLANDVPHSRLLFVRRRDRAAGDGLRAFAIRSGEQERWMRSLSFESYEELVGVDLAEAGEPIDHPLFLVCTHGKHDPCCAKFGRPLYDALREQVDTDWLWQSTHVGGDRFAGNLVSLPDGLYFGRVEPGDAWTVVDEALARRVHLPLYRGRSCYPFPVQAAEIAVREHAGLTEVDAVRHVATTRVGGDRWTIAFATAGGEAYDVDVRRVEGPLTHLTCKSPELRHPRHFVASTPVASTPGASGSGPQLPRVP